MSHELRTVGKGWCNMKALGEDAKENIRCFLLEWKDKEGLLKLGPNVIIILSGLTSSDMIIVCNFDIISISSTDYQCSYWFIYDQS